MLRSSSSEPVRPDRCLRTSWVAWACALIIDRHAGPSLQTRALGVRASTLEICLHPGILERALELGKRATGANIWAQGRRSAQDPVGDIGGDLSPYRFRHGLLPGSPD